MIWGGEMTHSLPQNSWMDMPHATWLKVEFLYSRSGWLIRCHQVCFLFLGMGKGIPSWPIFGNNSYPLQAHSSDLLHPFIHFIHCLLQNLPSIIIFSSIVCLKSVVELYEFMLAHYHLKGAISLVQDQLLVLLILHSSFPKNISQWPIFAFEPCQWKLLL